MASVIKLINKLSAVPRPSGATEIFDIGLQLSHGRLMNKGEINEELKETFLQTIGTIVKSSFNDQIDKLSFSRPSSVWCN